MEDTTLSSRLTAIVSDLGLDNGFPTEDGLERISLAVIDLSNDPPRLGGVHAESFIYPASVYKMYVAAEVLHQIEQGKASLDTTFAVRAPNVVDRKREVAGDPRPLLVEGDEPTLGYLLDLMITRSDNSAANCLIDFAQRPQINEMLHSYGWQGSEVTRKFLKRSIEDAEYRQAPGTQTCARHAADFLYRIRTRTLVSPWVSMQLESLLGRQLDDTKMARGLPRGAMFYHKTGWYANWTHDVGIVDDGHTRFVIAAFLPLPEGTGADKLAELGRRVFALLSKPE
jgi:beta-lactamase class A